MAAVGSSASATAAVHAPDGLEPAAPAVVLVDASVPAVDDPAPELGPA